MSVPLWNVGGDLLGGRPGHLRDRDGVGKVGCRVAQARAGLPDSVVPGRPLETGQVMCAQGAVILGGHPEQRAGHGRSIAA
ncbi:hypothetical protein [Streptosporangium subroseum]|uniref:hypothetical protein n=1 Tax=Streptosporangium subroseum TaxID=106412 RepID=UPI001181610E|nr:hypothetical protein [Streptosporangium subroseum]